MKIGPSGGGPPRRIDGAEDAQPAQENTLHKKSDTASAQKAQDITGKIRAERNPKASPAHHTPPPMELTHARVENAASFAGRLKALNQMGALTVDNLMSEFLKLQASDPLNDTATLNDIYDENSKLRKTKTSRSEEQRQAAAAKASEARDYAKMGDVLPTIMKTIQDILAGKGGGKPGKGTVQEAADSATKTIDEMRARADSLTMNASNDLRA